VQCDQDEGVIFNCAWVEKCTCNRAEKRGAKTAREETNRMKMGQGSHGHTDSSEGVSL
jgi:hypothetical protein